MQTITEIIADLSIDIACLLDEPSEVTEKDLIKMQDLIHKQTTNKRTNHTKKP